MGDVRFIRKNGRIIPIRAKNSKGKSVAIKEKSYVGTKTVNLDTGDRFAKGFRKWGNIGAIVGGAGGAIYGASEAGAKGAAIGGVVGAANGLLNWGLLGGIGTAAFGDRKGQVKIRKKKMTSRGY